MAAYLKYQSKEDKSPILKKIWLEKEPFIGDLLFNWFVDDIDSPDGKWGSHESILNYTKKYNLSFLFFSVISWHKNVCRRQTLCALCVPARQAGLREIMSLRLCGEQFAGNNAFAALRETTRSKQCLCWLCGKYFAGNRGKDESAKWTIFRLTPSVCLPDAFWKISAFWGASFFLKQFCLLKDFCCSVEFCLPFDGLPSLRFAFLFYC